MGVNIWEGAKAEQVAAALETIAQNGSSGTYDYDELTDKPRIGGVELSGNRTLHDLGIASESDVNAKYTKPGGGIPASDLASSVLTSIIDDTAGDGTTNKVWSANQSARTTEELSGEISGKAPGIFDETSESHTHQNLILPQNITFKGNANAFATAKYADRYNYVKRVAAYSSTSSDMNWSRVDGFVMFDGTPTATSYVEFCDWNLSNDMIPAGSYKYIIQYDTGNSVLSSKEINYIIFKYADGTNNSEPFYGNINGNDCIYNVTFSQPVKQLRLLVGYNKNNTYTNYKVWLGLFPADVTITDTGETVANGSTYTHTINLPNATELSSMQHVSTVNAIVDTKTYIDGHFPEDMLTKGDLVYVTPEMYGAKGDGVRDDTAEINACIADVFASPSNPKAAIRGFGRYKITSGITFYGAYADVYLRNIIYTGNDAAVTIIGAYNKIRFSYISAISGGANSVGIRCTTKPTPVYSYDGFYDNIVECENIVSNGNSVELIYPNTASTEGVYYSNLKFMFLYSTNGNCIYLNGKGISEVDIYGKIAHAPLGYLFYRETLGNNGGNSTHTSIRLHNFGIEHTVRNGIKGNAALIECRTRELMDRAAGQGQTHENNGGYLFDFTGVVPSSFKDDVAGDVDITACKVDGALQYGDIVNMAKTLAENGGSTYAVGSLLGIEGRSYALLKNCCRVDCKGAPMLIPGDLYVYYRHVAYKPCEEWYHRLTGDYEPDYVTYPNQYITPTVFDIDTSSAAIRLDYSYCCIAINEFRVIQHEGKTAVVYDKLGNIIFDGTNLSPGTYVFKCSRVPLNGITLELDNDETFVIPSEFTRRIYTGENEEWTVTKDISDKVEYELYKRPEIKPTLASGVDLDVADVNGNVLMRLAGGNVKTKNFDSSATPETKTGNATSVDLDVCDESGNVILRLKDGDIQTKNFNSHDPYLVPSYYHANDYLAGKCARFNQIARACDGKMDTFTFCTDQHWHLNAKKSPALLKYIKDHTNIDKFFFGGDFCDFIDSEHQPFDGFRQYNEALKSPLYTAMGNHDYMSQYGTEGRLYYSFNSVGRDRIGNFGRNYFYLDNPQSMIRYIFLNGFQPNGSGSWTWGFEQDQLTWLSSTALDLESGWGAIIVTHMTYGVDLDNNNNIYTPTAASNMLTILDSYSGNGEIIAVVCGHMHFDYLGATTGGIPIIVTTSDKYFPWISGGVDKEPWLSDRTAGTITEQAIDMFVVDREAKEITRVRVGVPIRYGTDPASWTEYEEVTTSYDRT